MEGEGNGRGKEVVNVRFPFSAKSFSHSPPSFSMSS